jgi:type VI secretion system protein ImpE
MVAEEHIRAERLDEALASLQEAIRAQPSEARLRVFLFQLLCVMGRWERAMTQLQVLQELDADSQMLAHIYRTVLNCEALRAEVFAGKRTPLIFGEPPAWIGALVQACQLVAQGQRLAGAALRQQAFDEAPATPGKINGQSFDWIADADTRLGPVLEVMIEGRYYWVPFERIRRIEMEKPTDLRDLVWMPARFTWTNGGEAMGFIPTRYPGTESSGDNTLRMSRKTDWVACEGEGFHGVGQRLITTDSVELPLLEIHLIEMEQFRQPSQTRGGSDG